MDTLPLNYTKWSDRLALDVALTLEGSGETLQEVMNRHHITALDILEFNKDPLFLKKVDTFRGEGQPYRPRFSATPSSRSARTLSPGLRATS